jgi:hypothetical protein
LLLKENVKLIVESAEIAVKKTSNQGSKWFTFWEKIEKGNFKKRDSLVVNIRYVGKIVGTERVLQNLRSILSSP